jgi:hypothetical protein
MSRYLFFKRNTLISTFLFLSINFSNAQVYNGTKLVPGHIIPIKDQNVNWDSYDSTSIVKADMIELKDIQGKWKAYKGMFKYDDIVRGFEISKPFFFEVKNNKARRNTYDALTLISLKKNLIVMFENQKVIAGTINKISSNELTITWKGEVGYSRYYYAKE